MLLVLALAAGCAGPGRQADVSGGADWVERKERLQEIAEFRMEGRLALNTGRKGYSGTVSWEQNDDLVDFRFRGPFGFGGFRIHGDNERLRIKTTGGDELQLTDPERDMNERFGWSLPVHSMRYWILGVSDPRTVATEAVDDEGLLDVLEQSGWTVRYDGYREASGLVLPRKLEMTSGEVRIKVVADRWDLPGDEVVARR
jgi:outer membrane lipoprotein LolB